MLSLHRSSSLFQLKPQLFLNPELLGNPCVLRALPFMLLHQPQLLCDERFMFGLRFCSGGSSSLKSASLLVGCRRISKSEFVVRRLLDEGLNGLLRWDMLRRYNFRWLLRRRVRCRRIQRRKLLPHLQSARRLVSKLMLRCRSWRSARSLRIRYRWPRRWGRRSYRGLRWSMNSVRTRSSWWSLEQLNSPPHEPR